jgi:hypothetical protein
LQETVPEFKERRLSLFVGSGSVFEVIGYGAIAADVPS